MKEPVLLVYGQEQTPTFCDTMSETEIYSASFHYKKKKKKVVSDISWFLLFIVYRIKHLALIYADFFF